MDQTISYIITKHIVNQTETTRGFEPNFIPHSIWTLFGFILEEDFTIPALQLYKKN